MKQLRLVGALCASFCLLNLCLTPALASTVEGTYLFSATGFTSYFNNAVPVDPVTGSFTISFDSAQNYTDETAGITLNDLNIVLDSAISFTYLAGSDQLYVGGIAIDAASVGIDPASNDFYLEITGLGAGNPPHGAYFVYSQTSSGPQADFYTDSGVSVSAVPLPPAAWLFGAGSLGLVGVARQRKAA